MGGSSKETRRNTVRERRRTIPSARWSVKRGCARGATTLFRYPFEIAGRIVPVVPPRATLRIHSGKGDLPAAAPIEGDATKGAYFGYVKLPAGLESPPHSHTNDYWSVLIQGQMTHWAADGGSEKDSKAIGPGGWTHMPAKVAHISKCYPGADCIMVMVQKGKSDFVPAAPPKKM
jgi:quercetin dioxygenase-like cupin family protein